MKVIDSSKDQAQTSVLAKIEGYLDQLLRFGDSGDQETKAQQIIVAQLDRLLDNRHILLRNQKLSGTDHVIPLILIGPFGAAVLYASHQTGVFRARDEDWLVMNRTTKRFQRAPKNLIEATLKHAQIFQEFLTHAGMTLMPQAALILSHPGVNVETSRPAVRIVRIDGLDHYASDLLQDDSALNSSAIQQLVDLLTTVEIPAVVEEEKQPQEKPVKAMPVALQNLEQINLPPALAKVRLKKREWILIAVMATLEVIFLIAFILYILLTA